jgi:hypothetical protein
MVESEILKGLIEWDLQEQADQKTFYMNIASFLVSEASR